MAETYDIVVVGAGLAGLTAAAAFGGLGFSVACIDPRPEGTEIADTRSTALLQPSQAFCEDIGLWDQIAPIATPLHVMKINDVSSGQAPRAYAFDAADLGDAPFGWNVPNTGLRSAVQAHLQDLPSVTMRFGASVTGVATRSSRAQVTLSDGTRLWARLIIGADGRGSQIRRAVGIGQRTWRYGQTGLSCVVEHEIPHENASIEVHASGGPFTLVPLPAQEGCHRSALVWLEKAATAETLRTLPTEAFNTAITERSGECLGALRLIGPRMAWPIISQLADRLTAERTALIAEAAHVVPPIGAQGLNMSLSDAAHLRQLISETSEDPGSPHLLTQYAKRHRALAVRVRGIDMLNRASITGLPVAQLARRAILAGLHDIAPIRHQLMKLGLAT